jgi:hypothetical protein
VSHLHKLKVINAKHHGVSISDGPMIGNNRLIDRLELADPIIDCTIL